MSYITLPVPLECKQELDQELTQTTPETNEVLLRLGLTGLRLLTTLHQDQNPDIQHIKHTYEQQIQQHQHEHEVLVNILTKNQDLLLEQRVQTLQGDLDRWRHRCDLLESEKQHQKEEQDERMSRVLEQKQEELVQLRESMVRLSEQLATSEKLRDLEIRDRLTTEIETLRKDQEDHFNTKYQELLEQYTMTKNDLVRVTEELKSTEKMTELTVKAKVNEVEVRYIQQRGQQVQELEEELKRTREQLEESKMGALQVSVEQQRKEMETIKEALSQRKQSSQVLGTVGEKYFTELAQKTFATYDGFDIEDKTKVGHAGDFHLKFRDCGTILVDVKNFDVGRISTTDVAKFRYDLTRNPSIRIGWLISLNSHICNYSKQPVVMEMEEGRLLVFVNELRNSPDPGRMLQDIYYTCVFVYNQILNVETNTAVLNNYKRFEKRVKESADQLQKSWKKTKTTMNQLREDMLDTEKHIKGMMIQDLMAIRDEHTTTVQEWWDEWVVETPGVTIKLRSNELYEHFIKTKGATSIKNDQFKMILKEIVPVDHLQLPKHDRYQYVVAGYVLKDEGP
jgi:DNA integrity scanning protein DisA with diadenylate cyclase activity